MKFKYQAKTKEGELQVGYVEATDRDAAVDILTGHDLFILKIEGSERPGFFERLSSYFTGVKRQDMVIFTRQLATLLDARLSLNKALTTLYTQTTNPALKDSLRQINEDVNSGLAFSQALGRQSEIFSNFFVSMVRSAEVTGNLDQVARFLADYTEREAILATKARSALVYPAIIITLFMAVASILLFVVFPKIKPVFDQSGVDLPLITRILLGSGDFVTRWWLAILIVLGILAVMLLDYLRTPEGRALGDDLKIRLPLLRKIYLPITITRFANASAMLSKGGVPVAQAMEIVSETIDNALYRDVLHEVSESVREGTSLSDSIARHPDYFPALVPQMIAVGEATGQLDEMFLRIANFYAGNRTRWSITWWT